MIRLYYQNAENNFGDILSKEIVSYFAKSEVEWSPLKRADLVALGSLGERVALKKFKRYCLSLGRPLNIWGMGFLQPGSRISSNFLKIHALRGMHSKERFGIRSPLPLGDPGLLVPLIYDFKRESTNQILCLGHLHDTQANKWIDHIREINPDKKIVHLCLSNDVKKVVYEIARSEAVVSSAMHPLIVAQSYEVPFMWVNCGENLHAGNRYKFEDYFSVFNMTPESVDVNFIFQKKLTNAHFYKVIEESIVSSVKIHTVQQDLIDSFPREAL